MDEFIKESHKPQAFLAAKRDEEEQMMSKAVDNDSESPLHANENDEEYSDDEDFDFETFALKQKTGRRNRAH